MRLRLRQVVLLVQILRGWLRMQRLLLVRQLQRWLREFLRLRIELRLRFVRLRLQKVVLLVRLLPASNPTATSRCYQD